MSQRKRKRENQRRRAHRLSTDYKEVQLNVSGYPIVMPQWLMDEIRDFDEVLWRRANPILGEVIKKGDVSLDAGGVPSD